MGKKSSSTPDPYQTAAAQTQSNEQTAAYNAALNRTSQYTPYGNSVYSQTGVDSTGAPTWSNTISLTPEAQKQLDNQMAQNDQLSNIGFGLANQAQSSMANPVSTANLPALQYGASGGSIASSIAPTSTGITSSVGASPITSGIGPTGRVQSGVAPTQSRVQSGIAPTSQSMTASANGGQIQSGLDTSGVSALPNAGDYANQIQQARDASYSAATRYLDPQYTNAQNDLDAKLANQGVVQGSDAWNRAETQLGNQRTQAYGAAQDSAVSAGNALQAQLFGQGLSANAQGMANAVSAGNFANSAQAQGYNQSLQNAQLGNAVQAQQYTQNANNATFNNTAQAQQFSQNEANANLNNTAQAQRYTQAMGQADLANTAQAQQYSQGLSNAQLGNTAQAQQYSQNAQNATFANSAQAQAYSQAAQNAALNNSTQAQALQQQAYLATLPLNELNALRSGTQIMNPSFTTAPTSTAAGTDISGDIYKSAQMDQASSNNFMNGLFGLGVAGISAAGKAGGLGAFFSDRRLKRDIVRVGRTPVMGLPVYEFSYTWAPDRRHRGVMADEVQRVAPHAVLRHPSGYRMVDYRMVS